MTNLNKPESVVSPENALLNGQVLDAQLPDAPLPDESVLPLSLSTLDSSPVNKELAVNRPQGSLPLEAMMDVPITLVFEVGRTPITIKQLMELSEGSYIELRHISVDSIDVRVNDIVIAEAETIALQQRYGIRFGEVAMITNFEVESEQATE